MKIEPPPTSIAYSIPGFDYMRWMDLLIELRRYFQDEDFDKIYYSQFGWFVEELPSRERVLNIGCGSGRETFALLWELQATEAVGIDINYTDLGHAKQIVRWIRDLSNQMIGPIRRRPTQDAGFEQWYQVLPAELKYRTLPQFTASDVTETIPYSEGYFDVVYCSYVLDGLVNEDLDWRAAIENMAAVTRPVTGRVIVRGPTKRDSTKLKHSKCFISHDDLVPYFQRVGLELITAEGDSDKLGHIKWPETDPKGYVFARRQ